MPGKACTLAHAVDAGMTHIIANNETIIEKDFAWVRISFTPHSVVCDGFPLGESSL